MAFDAYKYARTFEKLACKIIEKEISEEILVSGITKKTRDGGIDAIIHTKNNFVTIEAKLRKNSVSLGLKDIASSVIFYLLRLNDKHYIVTNVYLATDTINVLNKLNKAKECDIHYVDGDNTIKILKEMTDSLDDDEKELTNILLQEFCENKKSAKERITNEPKDSYSMLLKIQLDLCDSICNAFDNGKKCVVLSGKIGTGKSLMANAIIDRLSTKYNTIFVDCQQYNTIESFMYQLSNIQIGIDINELINEYISISDEFEKQSNIVSIERSDTFSVLTQILSRNQYSDSLKFLAQKYIDKLIDDFNSNSVCIIIDNYSAASAELDDFISSYILHSTPKLRFFIVKETDYGTNTSIKLEKTMCLPINMGSFEELYVKELNFADTCFFVDSICPNLSQVYKKNLYSSFGGNMLMIKMALNEMKSCNNYNSSLLRPLGCEKLYENKIAYYLTSDAVYIKLFFVCWIMNSRLPQSFLPLNRNYNIYELLQQTGLFSESNTSLALCNMCVYNVISKYFINYSPQLYVKIKDFISELKVQKLSLIAQIRIGFFTKSNDFVRFSKKAIPIFENKSEHDNIIETRALLYFYTRDYINIELLQIEAASNLLYEMIDNDIYNIRFDLDISEPINDLENFFADFEIFGRFEQLQSNEKAIISEARLKYAIYLYFDSKRKNDFLQAYSCINVPEVYTLNCQNSILISKIIRFKAICQKELGNRCEFFNVLSTGISQFPQNKYLLAVYNANLAADKNLENPIEAISIIENKALPAAELVDKYLHLWLLNDRLIYAIQAQKYDNNQVLEAYKTIVCKAERLCSVTDRARADNTYGAFCLKYSNDSIASCEYFKNALYMISKHEYNNIMFYFAVNYIQMLPKDEYEEFNNISEMILNWCKCNIDYIVKKAEDSDMPSNNNKLIMALYSFADVLKRRKDHRYQFFIKIDGISDIFTKRISMNTSFYIKGIPLILF